MKSYVKISLIKHIYLHKDAHPIFNLIFTHNFFFVFLSLFMKILNSSGKVYKKRMTTFISYEAV